MEEAISFLLRLGVFEVIKRRQDRDALHNKLLYKTKTDAEAQVERFKLVLLLVEKRKGLGSIMFLPSRRS